MPTTLRVRCQDALSHWTGPRRRVRDQGGPREVGRYEARWHDLDWDNGDLIVLRRDTPRDDPDEPLTEDEGSTPEELMAAGGPMGLGGNVGPAIVQTTASETRDSAQQPARSLLAGRTVRDYHKPSPAQAEQAAQRIRDKDRAVRDDDARRLKDANERAKAFWSSRGGR